MECGIGDEEGDMAGYQEGELGSRNGLWVRSSTRKYRKILAGHISGAPYDI